MLSKYLNVPTQAKHCFVVSLQPECLGCLWILLFHKEDWKAWYPTQWLSDSLSLCYLVCPFFNWTHPSKGQMRAGEKARGMNPDMAYVNHINRLKACFISQARGAILWQCSICSVLLHKKGRAWRMNECLHVLNGHGGLLVQPLLVTMVIPMWHWKKCSRKTNQLPFLTCFEVVCLFLC